MAHFPIGITSVPCTEASQNPQAQIEGVIVDRPSAGTEPRRSPIDRADTHGPDGRQGRPKAVPKAPRREYAQIFPQFGETGRKGLSIYLDRAAQRRRRWWLAPTVTPPDRKRESAHRGVMIL